MRGPFSLHLSAGAIVLAVAMAGVAAAAQDVVDGPPYGTLVDADHFTDTAGPLEDGELELAVLSTLAATVTGGDALIGVRGLDGSDEVTVTRNGEDVTGVFAFDDDGVFVGLVDGLVEGENDVTVVADHPAHGLRGATLPVTNHPVVGPVFSGPHQEPFICRTEASGLGDPIDEYCSIEPRAQWFYFDEDEQDYRRLDDPYGPYPSSTGSTTTTEGTTVPLVVRIETRTINRGITKIAVIDDPAARGPDAPYEVTNAWNGRALHEWGPSCGVGRHQGTIDDASVLTGLLDIGTGPITELNLILEAPVARGYIVAASTLTALGVHCNTVLSAETFMMIREHITEQYGRPVFVFGNGASGGAIQQVTTMDNYPGLLDGGVPTVTFPDVITTAMSPSDCRLLLRVFAQDELLWNELTMQAVTGHRTSQICRDWDDLFAQHLEAATGCHGSIPDELVYHPETNPAGVRCTLQDALVNIMGIDPDTGVARRPLDNEGVQYGLEALGSGLITPEMFVTLNEEAGGYDVDGNIVGERMSIDEELARLMYEIGAVAGRGALGESPVIFVSPYIDLIPVAGFHDFVRAYMLRERLRETFGTEETHAIWGGAPLPNDAWPVMEQWLTDLTAQRDQSLVAPSWTADVVATRPPEAIDGCVITTLGQLVWGGIGIGLPPACEAVFEPKGSPRIAAGGPLAEDIIKCSRAPLDRASHPGTFTDDQWQRLGAVFPMGVCDWTQPGVGEVERSRTWLRWDDVGAEPTAIPHVVARSAPLTLAAPSEEETVEPPPSPLPTTGANWGLLALGLLLAGRLGRGRG